MPLSPRFFPRLALVIVTAALFGAWVSPLLAAEVTISITDRFDPSDVTVPPGTTVIWVNESAERHRVRTTSGPDEFDSGDLEVGEQFSVTLSLTGTYQYRDDRNRDNSAFWAQIVVSSTPAPTPPGGTAPPPPPSAADVSMAGQVFSPTVITIAVGGTVTWHNNDGRDHTVTSTNGSFGSGTLAPGQQFAHTFPAAGTFNYLCIFHSNMTGTVQVTAPGSSPPPPPPPPPVATPAPPVPGPPGSASIRAVDFAFQPTSVTVAAGSRVTFLNAGQAPHTMTAQDGSFDSGIVASGNTWTRTLLSPGTYRFLCTLHPVMIGTIVVTDASGSAPPPASPAPSPSQASQPPPSSEPGSLDLEIRDFAFVPSSISVEVGTTVTWFNSDAAPHTVTAQDGSFDSGAIGGGESWSRAFDQEGTFNFVCTFHPAMTGTIAVTAGSGSAESAAPSAAPPAGPRDAVDSPPGTGSAPFVVFGLALALAGLPVVLSLVETRLAARRAEIRPGR